MKLALASLAAMLALAGALSLGGADLGGDDGGWRSVEERAAEYADRYGGAEGAYAELLNATDCAWLQQKFDIANRNGTTGFMVAADDQMESVGCDAR